MYKQQSFTVQQYLEVGETVEFEVTDALILSATQGTLRKYSDLGWVILEWVTPRPPTRLDGTYDTFTFDGLDRVSTIITWVDNTETEKVEESQFSYNEISQVTQEVQTFYQDNIPTLQRTYTYTYDGEKPTSVEVTEVNL